MKGQITLQISIHPIYEYICMDNPGLEYLRDPNPACPKTLERLNLLTGRI